MSITREEVCALERIIKRLEEDNQKLREKLKRQDQKVYSEDGLTSLFYTRKDIM